MYLCPYSKLEVLDLYSLVLPSLGRIEVVIPTILWLASVGFIIHYLHPSITFQLCFQPDLLLDLWHGGPFPTRAFVGQASLFICVSALSCLGCLLETSSAAISTMYLEIKWISMKKSDSWKVVFLNIHECKANLMKLALKKVLQWNILNIHEK